MLNSTRVDQKNIEGFIVAPMKKNFFNFDKMFLKFF